MIYFPHNKGKERLAALYRRFLIFWGSCRLSRFWVLSVFLLTEHRPIVMRWWLKPETQMLALIWGLHMDNTGRSSMAWKFAGCVHFYSKNDWGKDRDGQPFVHKSLLKVFILSTIIITHHLNHICVKLSKVAILDFVFLFQYDRSHATLRESILY